jgi:hypothetical protein
LPARNRPALKPDHFRAILVHCTKNVRAGAPMNNLWPVRLAAREHPDRRGSLISLTFSLSFETGTVPALQ